MTALLAALRRRALDQALSKMPLARTVLVGPMGPLDAGRLVRELLESGHAVTQASALGSALDPADFAAAPAGTSQGQVRCDASRFPFRDRSFDLALRGDVGALATEAERVAALTELARVAKRWVITLNRSRRVSDLALDAETFDARLRVLGVLPVLPLLSDEQVVVMERR